MSKRPGAEKDAPYDPCYDLGEQQVITEQREQIEADWHDPRRLIAEALEPHSWESGCRRCSCGLEIGRREGATLWRFHLADVVISAQQAGRPTALRMHRRGY